MGITISEQRMGEVTGRAKNDAAAFVAEFSRPLDPARTDWDATAWGDFYPSLDLSDAEYEALWPIYQEHLVAETERLASDAARRRFLEAWEAAGRPQVEHITVPSSGRSGSHKLSHGDVLAYARSTGTVHFAKEHGQVELSWRYRPSLAEGVSSENRLVFDMPAED